MAITTTGAVIIGVSSFAAGFVTSELCHKQNRLAMKGMIKSTYKRVREGEVEMYKSVINTLDERVAAYEKDIKTVNAAKAKMQNDLRDAELKATTPKQEEVKK